MAEAVSEYERLRLENIRKNEELLQTLEIKSASSGLSEMAGAKRKRNSPTKDKNTKLSAVTLRMKREAKEAQRQQPQRRSRRVAGLAIEGGENGKALPKELKEPTVSSKRIPIDKPGDLLCTNSLRAPEFQENHEDFMSQLKHYSEIEDEGDTCSEGTASLFSKLTLKENNVVRLLPDRIFSLQFHPSTTSLILAAGDKWGRIGIWNVNRHLSSTVKEEEDGEEEISDEEPAQKREKRQESGEESAEEDKEESDQGEEESGDIEHNIVIYEPHSKPVTCIQWLGMDRLLSCGYDGRVRCLRADTQTFEEMHVNNRPVMWVTTGNLPENSAIFSLDDGQVLLYDIRTKKNKSYQLHEKKIYTVEVNKNGYTMATASLDSTVCLWDRRKIKQDSPLSEFKAKQSITSSFFSRVSGKRLIATSYDNHIYAWDDVINKGFETENLTSINHNNNTGRWLTGFKPFWHPQSDDIFSIGSMDRSVEIYSAKSGKRVSKLQHELLTTVPSLNAFHHGRNVIASSNAGGRVYLWME